MHISAAGALGALRDGHSERLVGILGRVLIDGSQQLLEQRDAHRTCAQPHQHVRTLPRVGSAVAHLGDLREEPRDDGTTEELERGRPEQRHRGVWLGAHAAQRRVAHAHALCEVVALVVVMFEQHARRVAEHHALAQRAERRGGARAQAAADRVAAATRTKAPPGEREG
jgi:hypothetical protein